MEISRHTPGYKVQTESTAPAKASPAAPAKSADVQAPSATPNLEQLQHAMGNLPEVDLDRVEQIKQALSRGEIALDNAALAKEMLSYHSGSDQ